jgi:very-short-patch-repair endonuclease
VIEIDGNQHGQDEALQRDRIRDDFLREQLFRVLRFSNADVQQ